MAYWIGIFAIVMAIPSILFSLHYYHSYENWEKKNKQQKKELDSEIEKIQKELQELIKEKDAALKENESVRNDLKDKFIKTEKEYDNLLEEKLNKYNVELNKKILKIKKTVDIETDKLKKSFRENRINTIMMCLSSFPDPQMVAEKEDKRIMVSDYLQLLYNEYSKYAQIVSILITQEKDDHYEETLKYVRLVLLSIKMAIIRSQSSFSELTQNIACHVLIRIIDSTTKDIASGKIPYTQLKDNLDKVLTSFLQVISYIKE
jgi:hypothetical protein